MGERHPKASRFILDHVVSLEAMLDLSILSGFSFGIEKAKLFQEKGELLGDFVGRTGRWPNGERIQAIQDFAVIYDKQQLQQFLGCTNWVRWFMTDKYPVLVKMIGIYLKPDATFPPEGLGAGATRDDKVIQAIKMCACYYINLAVMDEAAAMNGTLPLELLADCSGIAWGGSVYQMLNDLTRFKVLMTAGKGLTPAQQAWTPLVSEAYAQMELKRAQVRTLGTMRSVCWTDHANGTKQQVLEEVDIKL